MGVLQLDTQQKGLRFDGVNDYVNTTVSSFIQSLRFANSIYSFSIIYNTNINTRHQIIDIGNGDNTNRTLSFLFLSNLLILQQINTVTSNGQACNWAFTPVLGKDYNIVLVKNGLLANWELYVDGVLNTSKTVVTNIPIDLNAPISFELGVLDSSFFPLNGTIRDLKFFNKALNSTEVTELFNKTGIPSNCVADYRFNQQSGSILTDYANGNNGTLTNYTTGDVTIGSTNKWVYDYGSEPFDNSRKNGVLLINNN